MKATKQQTAVGWLYETLWRQTDFSLPNNILEKAKAMEKEQIIDAYTHDRALLKITAEQYYTENYYNPNDSNRI